MPRRRVTIATAPIPFRTAFRHASATRRLAENVIVRIEDDDGLVGLGEGCPRHYVTGETVATALEFLHRRAPALATEIDSVAELAAWIAGDDEIAANPSAACAIELALLDLLARRAGLPVERVLGLEPLTSSPHASAVYGDSPTPVFLMQALVFAWRGLRDAKLKLSGDPRRDHWRAKMLARQGPLRLDANNLWPDAASAVSHLAPLAGSAWAAEEPVKVRDFAGMSAISRETGLTIILDESFLSARDLEALPEDGKFAVNVRVSKHGGLIRTLQAIRAARARGLKVIVGAQVGETSILARAGLVAVSVATQGSSLATAPSATAASPKVKRPDIETGDAVPGHPGDRGDDDASGPGEVDDGDLSGRGAVVDHALTDPDAVLGHPLSGYEGGYGTHLLARDLTVPSLTIGNRGAFHGEAWAAISRPGLGLDLSPDAPLVEPPKSAAAR